MKKVLKHCYAALYPFIFKRKAKILLNIQKHLKAQGLTVTEIWIRDRFNKPRDLSGYLVYLAQLIQPTKPKEAIRLAQEAFQLSPRISIKKWLTFKLFDAGDIQTSYKLSKELPFYAKINPYNKHKFQMIDGCFRLYTLGMQLPPIQPVAYEAIPNRILYVAASALPYHNTGYTIRTQNVLKHLVLAGWDIICLTRPGYPNDRVDRATLKKVQAYELEGVHYETLVGPHRRKTAPDEYLYHAAKILEDKIRHLRPALIQAASNYENALPALIAARNLGIPFVYEIRGLWELTSASKIPDYESSERFALEQSLEKLVGNEANLVFTLGKTLANELILRGLDAKKIQLAPNGADPKTFKTLEKDQALAEKLHLDNDAFVIGYAGAIVAYEGLDDLINAFYLLRDKIPHARLMIIGDGDALPALRQQVQTLNLEKHVYFIGKVPHSEIQHYYSLFDVITLPRKSFKVCQLVTPLKPLEAMGMGIPLIVSNVNALQEMVQADETALVHRTEDPNSLAEAILRLALDPALREKLATQARQEVISNRTWMKICQDMTAHYERLILNISESALIKNKHLLKYETLMNNHVDVSSIANKIISTGWTLGSYPNVPLNKIPWALKTEKERSWNYHIHCWDMLDCLLQAHSQTGETQYLQPACEVALEWIAKQSNPNTSISPFAWYDMAVGLRAYRLAYLIDACDATDILDPKLRALLWQSLKHHQVYLSNDAHIAFHNNHGFFQIAGQLAMGRRFSAMSPLMVSAYTQGQQRLQKILQQQFSAEGVHREHSPDYHRMVYDTLNRMMQAGLIEAPEMLVLAKRIEEALSWFILPNGHICNFGDSDYRMLKGSPADASRLWSTPTMQYVVSQGAVGSAPQTDYMAFPQSGYFIVRKPSSSEPAPFEQASYLAQTAAFHSRTHKHADDLSFIWSDRGSDILIDAGRYGYIGKPKMGSKLWREGHWYSDPNRIYCESTRAHNTLEFDNHDYKRKGAKPYGSAIKHWTRTSNNIFAVETEVEQFNSIQHARVLVLNPNAWLLVFDWFNDNKQQEHNVKQWFHLAPHLALEKNDASYTIPLSSSAQPLKVCHLLDQASASHIYHGEKTPEMQGWWSEKERTIIPVNAFCYELPRGSTGALATLFCFTSHLQADYSCSNTDNLGRKINLQWQDDYALHTLNITRNVDALRVNYEKS